MKRNKIQETDRKESQVGKIETYGNLWSLGAGPTAHALKVEQEV